MHQNNHQYKVGDTILVKRKKNSNHELEFMGPLPITQINDNGTVRFQKGNHHWCHKYLQDKTILRLKHTSNKNIFTAQVVSL